VFEDTRGIRPGDRVELSGELLSAALGPGLLGQVYDGLQNPLAALWTRHGTFLQRGARVPPLDPGRRWAFEPAVAKGAPVAAGQALGHVQENRIAHPVVVPFDLEGDWTLDWIDDDGSVSGEHPVAALSGPDGARRTVSLIQRWPVRRSLGADLVRSGRAERLYSGEPLLTGIRLIDSFFPVARGGTACIPGPFGAGKTVTQHLIARFAQADVVVMVACGERAGVHINEDHFYPEIIDPKTGEVLPEGSEGELAFTTLTKEGIPMLRYRTRDITRLIYEPCRCGRTNVRMELVKGRSDDMMVIRGTNVFPSQIESVLMMIPGIGPHYQIVVTTESFMDKMEVQVELTDGSLLERYSELEKLTREIRQKIHSVLQIDVKVTLLSPNTIERSTGKAKRVIDLRGKAF
jgi:hypothetical protein